MYTVQKYYGYDDKFDLNIDDRTMTVHQMLTFYVKNTKYCGIKNNRTGIF